MKKKKQAEIYLQKLIEADVSMRTSLKKLKN